MKKLLYSVIYFGFSNFLAFATNPWSFSSDLSYQSSWSGDWHSDDSNEGLDWWGDGHNNNISYHNDHFSFEANDEASQQGLMYLKSPENYGNGPSPRRRYWNISPNTEIHPSWTAVVKVSLNASLLTSSSNGFLEGGILIRNQWSGYPGTTGVYSNIHDKQSYWTGFGINQSGEKYLCAEMSGTSTSSDYFFSQPLTISEIYLKVVFDAELLTLSSYYTDDIQNPDSTWNNPFRTESLLSWNNYPGWTPSTNDDYLKSLMIGVGGGSEGTTVQSGNLLMTDFNFNMVPEPSALSLLVVGLGGLAMMRRRRS